MSQIKKIIFGIILIIAIGGLVVVAKQPKQDLAQPQTLRIGFIGGLTGEYGVIGENYVKGARLAEKVIEAENLNLNIELIVEDDQFDTKKSLSAYHKLMTIDHIDALINETTPSIDVIYGQVVAAGLPVIQGGEQSENPQDDDVFQIQPGMYESEIALGSYLRGKGFEQPAALVTSHPAMLRFFAGLESGFSQEINLVKFSPGHDDLRTPIIKLLDHDHDVLVLLLFPNDGARAVKVVNEIANNPIKLAFDANIQSGFTTYEEVLGDTSLLNGSIVATIKDDVDSEFQDLYLRQYGIKPGIGSAWGYDALSLLIETYDPDTAKWNENIKNSTLNGASGLIEFDAVGVRRPDYEITTIENGEIVMTSK